MIANETRSKVSNSRPPAVSPTLPLAAGYWMRRFL